jgi:hypothetical protein
LGERLSAWPQETKVGPANVTTFSEWLDLVIELEARETETRLRHAERLDAFEERLQRQGDAFAEGLRNTAAAAGEALERTKGLQVPEILRRLSQTERRINLMDGGRVALEQQPATDDRLLNAVTELTTVMREAVAAQREGAVLVQRGLDALTPPEVCGAPDQIGHVTCELEKGHTSRHVNGISSWPQKADPEPRTCPATLTKGVDELQTLSVCTRPPGHPGMHREGDEESWLAQS